MKKEFIPYELALALKELGFDEPCLGWYLPEIVDKGNIASVILGSYINKWNKFGDRLSAPTFSQAFRWFREKYGDYLLYSFGVIPHFTIIQNLIIEDSKITYEEAELECLNKLIEIVKK